MCYYLMSAERTSSFYYYYASLFLCLAAVVVVESWCAQSVHVKWEILPLGPRRAESRIGIGRTAYGFAEPRCARFCRPLGSRNKEEEEEKPSLSRQ